jgi:dihydroflavonol-4-reductase
MRVGITGANGFIGNHLLRSAIAKGHRPVVFLQRGSSIRAIEDIQKTEGELYITVWGDLLDTESLDQFVSQCDVVFHLAGFNRYWAQNPNVFLQVNLDGVRNVAEACLKHGVKKLIHVSSCVTLGASLDPTLRNEDSDFNLRGVRFPYAETKKAGEDLVISYVKERGLPAVIVHPTSAIGEQDFGPTPIGKPIADISQGKWPVYVAGGACFIDVHDVVRGLWLALEHGRVGEKYLFAGENLTNQQFMSLVAECAGVPKPKMKVPLPLLKGVAWTAEFAADRITRKEPVLTVGMTALIGKYLYFDGSKAERELGFKAGPTAPAIQRCIEWFRTEDSARGAAQ